MTPRSAGEANASLATISTSNDTKKQVSRILKDGVASSDLSA